MSDLVLVETSAGITTIRMNRPEKKNALTIDMYAQMVSAIDKANADSSINVIVMLGAQGAFTAGNDITDFLEMAGERDSASMPVFEFLERIIMAEKPLVAGVDGLAIGIGTTMLLHCDYVVASDTSLFKTPFVDLGLVPEAGSSLLAPRLMGHQRAFELLVMGNSCSAEEGKSAGFINQVTSSSDVESTAMGIATNLAAKPQQALKLSRDLVRGDRSDILVRMREEALLFDERLRSDEAKAAFEAFMSKGKKSG